MSSTTDTDLRSSQRAPQSCSRCSARKIKCSKTIPCQSCTSLGLASQCEREVVIITRRDRASQAPRSHGRRGRPRGSLNKRTAPSTRITPPALGAPTSEGSGHRHIPSGSSNPLVFQTQDKHRESTDDGRGFFHESRPETDILPQQPQDVWLPSARPECTLQHQSKQTHRARPLVARPAAPNTWLNEDALAENAAMTLELLAWGRQRDAVVSPEATIATPHPTTGLEVLEIDQAQGVIDFHRASLTWMHNVIHWPSFYRECEEFWRSGMVEEKSWSALYYAILSLGVHHMKAEQKIALGIYDADTSDNLSPGIHSHTTSLVSRRLYERSYQALKEADFMTTPSTNVLKSIIILSLLAHSFDGSHLISMLLSTANRIAQTLRFHQMGPDPIRPLKPDELVDREIRKRIWMFLCIQDWLLIPFCNSYTILPQHCNTPMPLNSDEFSGLPARLDHSVPIVPTHMAYILVMYRVAGVCRSFYDKTISGDPASQEESEPLRGLYNHVLSSDEELKSIIKSLPHYLQRGAAYDPKYPPFVTRQRKTFTISIAHKTIMIHQRFFLKSLKDKWYTYTRMTCIQSARTILEEYLASYEDDSNDIWTILAHVVTAAIILLLDHLLSEDSPLANRQLVCDCVALIERSEKRSTIQSKGTRLIRILLQHQNQQSPPDLLQISLLLNNDDLLRQDGRQLEDQTMQNGRTAESWDWNEAFLSSFDMTFDGTFV